ncbi:sensor histidine kinase, partial [Spirochaetota bacterium]
INLLKDPIINGILVNYHDISERKKVEKVLKESKDRVRRFTENSQDMIYRMSLPDGKYEYVSPSSVDIYGYEPEEWYDNPLLIAKIIPPNWEEYFKNEHSKLLAGNLSPTFEHPIIHKTGKVKWIHQRNVLVSDEQGNAIAIEGIVTDITERKKFEMELEKAHQKNKDLLKELQHRAKNSFAMISSLIGLTEDSSSSPDAKAALSEIGLQVHAVSELYDLLYSTDSVTDVRLDEYLSRVISSVPVISRNIAINKTLDSITMPMKAAIPVGIIVTELITNSIKHAFPKNSGGTISLSLKKEKAGAIIEVKDDGKGLPEGLDMSASDFLGLELIHALVSQIEGNLEIKSENGTRCVVKFPIEEAASS